MIYGRDQRIHKDLGLFQNQLFCNKPLHFPGFWSSKMLSYRIAVSKTSVFEQPSFCRILSLCILLLFIFFSSCNNTRPSATPAIEIENEEIAETIPRHTLAFLAAGDNLFHDTIIWRHKFDDGTYNFTSIYTEVKDIITSADLAFVNQETVMAGEHFGYSGYPLFNTPQSLAGTLVEAGFDILNLANNHAMDMGRFGLYATLDFLETIDELTVIGARKQGENQTIITKNNITLGFLAYTHSLNGIPLPADNPNLVSVINKDRMSEEINALRPLCDFLIVSMHWGDEYRLISPGPDQIDLALFLAEHNVDVIIGHHPHVLQRIEKLKRPDGKETLCFYSLGNFVSNQNRKERILGAFSVVTFVKEGESLFITDSGLLPVICHIEPRFTGTKIYPLYGYTQELMEKHILYSSDNFLDLYFFNTVVNRLDIKIFNKNPFSNTEVD